MERQNSFQKIVLNLVVSAVIVSLGCVSIAHEGHVMQQAPSTYIEITARVDAYQSDDFRHKKSERHYFATDIATNNKYEIHFDKKAPKHFKTGNIIQLRGLLIGSDLYLNSSDAETFAAASLTGTGATSTSLLAAGAAVSGVQNTLVISIDSNDAVMACDNAKISGLMFNDVNNSVNYMYQDASYGQLSFAGVVYDHVKIDVNSSGLCDYSGWSSAAEKVLSAQGVSLAGYNKKVYILPPNNNCGWAGLGVVNGSGAWINGAYCGTPDIYAHELGHNLALHHARTPTSEYGDYSDVMGIGGVGLRTLNAPHKIWMGWTPSSKVVAGGLGTFSIAPLEINPADSALPQVITLQKPDTNEVYYLSYRRQIGYDSRFLRSTYYDKLSIHTGSGGGSTLHAVLADAQSFSDSINGLTISVISHDTGSITFRVDGECTNNAPVLSLSPSTQGGRIGQAVNYSMTVRNNDSPYCPASVFNLSSLLPPELSASFSAAQVNVPAGSSVISNVAVTAISPTAAGSYNFQLSASDPAVAIHVGSVNGTLVIDSQAPSVPMNFSYSISRSRVNFSWSPSSDDVGVVGYEVARDGVVIATVSTNYYSTALKRGTYNYQVRARDAAGNVSAWSNVITIKK